MALEDKDRELIDLIVAQKVREQLDQNRGAVIDDVVNKLSSDPRLALFETQIRDRVETTVETALKRRYTAIAIVTAALVGGGAAAITQTFLDKLNTTASDVLRQNMAAMKAYEDFIEKSRQRLVETTEQFVPLREEIVREKALFESQNVISKAAQTTADSALGLLQKTLDQLELAAQKFTARGEQSPIASDEIKKLRADANQAQSVAEAGRFRVFLHIGPNIDPSMEKAIRDRFATNGYIVVGRDVAKDDSGGPRIDYFYDRDCTGAEQLSQMIGEVFNGSPRVPLKKEAVVNREGTLGVWLSQNASAQPGLTTQCPR